MIGINAIRHALTKVGMDVGTCFQDDQAGKCKGKQRNERGGEQCRVGRGKGEEMRREEVSIDRNSRHDPGDERAGIYKDRTTTIAHGSEDKMLDGPALTLVGLDDGATVGT